MIISINVKIVQFSFFQIAAYNLYNQENIILVIFYFIY